MVVEKNQGFEGRKEAKMAVKQEETGLGAVPMVVAETVRVASVMVVVAVQVMAAEEVRVLEMVEGVVVVAHRGLVTGKVAAVVVMGSTDVAVPWGMVEETELQRGEEVVAAAMVVVVVRVVAVMVVVMAMVGGKEESLEEARKGVAEMAVTMAVTMELGWMARVEAGPEAAAVEVGLAAEMAPVAVAMAVAAREDWEEGGGSARVTVGARVVVRLATEVDTEGAEMEKVVRVAGAREMAITEAANAVVAGESTAAVRMVAVAALVGAKVLVVLAWGGAEGGAMAVDQMAAQVRGAEVDWVQVRGATGEVVVVMVVADTADEVAAVREA